MGIKYLNRYLQSNCKTGISKISLNDLRGKKIAIDTSIYLYRFLGENALLENFYLMISIFREYNIIPLFVFDGKPPKEKNDLLKKRRTDKKQAEIKYNELKMKIDNKLKDTHEIDIKEFYETNEIKEIKKNMDMLKKNFIKVHHSDIENVKNLFQAYGISYIESLGEADKLCAKLVCKNKVFACLSEDMDLFVYGCPKVLRYMSLLNKNVIMYDLKIILSELNMSLDEFKYICIASGTDYNSNDNDINLFQTLKYFKKYKNNKINKNNNFYEWLEDNTNYIENIYDLYNINDLFNLSDMPEYKNYDKIKIINGPINESNLKNIMKLENFIFVN